MIFLGAVILFPEPITHVILNIINLIFSVDIFGHILTAGFVSKKCYLLNHQSNKRLFAPAR